MLTNRLGLPRAFVQRVEALIHDRDPNDAYTISELGLPPRLLALQRLHGDVVTSPTLHADVSEFTWLLFGSVAHDILATAYAEATAQGDLFEEPDQLVETRLRTVIDGYQISGKPDRLTGDGILEDHKFTSNWALKDGGKDEWHNQVRCYIYLARRAGYYAQGGRITAYLREWSPSTARGQRGKGGWYPPDPVAQIPVEPWSTEEAEAYLRSRIALHEALKGTSLLVRCTPEERWERPTTWAVLKTPQAKRASRVLETEAAAFEYVRLNGGSIQMRLGASPRCLDYCPVRSVCEQAWEYRFDAGEED